MNKSQSMIHFDADVLFCAHGLLNKFHYCLQVQPLAILVSWVMGSRHISVEDVSDAKTPAQNMPDVEEGLKCDGEAEANGKSTLCDRCDEETVRRCYICKEGPPVGCSSQL